MTEQWDPARTGRAVEHLLSTESGPVVIVAPFVKVGAFRRLSDMVGGPITLFTRWLPHEIASGVSDLGVFDVVTEAGGQVRLHPRVHAKLYQRGGAALAGSANATSNGLGFHDPAAVELLVPVALPSAPVSALLDLLERTTSIASEADRDAVAERAAAIDANAVAAPLPEAYPVSVVPTAVIRFRDPTLAWDYYRHPDQHDGVLVDRLLGALVELGVPPGVTDPEFFRSAVGAGMRQGAAGRVLRECRRLPAHAAIERFRTIMQDSGGDVAAADADYLWHTFCDWAAEFVPEVELRPSQVGF